MNIAVIGVKNRNDKYFISVDELLAPIRSRTEQNFLASFKKYPLSESALTFEGSSKSRISGSPVKLQRGVRILLCSKISASDEWERA